MSCACKTLRRLPLAILVTLFAACGGGGGGSSDGGVAGGSPDGNVGGDSGSGTGGGSTGVNVPAEPPAAPTLDYRGNAQSAQLGDTAVRMLASGIYFGIFLGLQLADESTYITLPESGVIDEVFPGPEGGTVRVTGRIATDGTGWVQYDLNAYTVEGITWTGVQVFERLQINNGLQDSLTEVRLIDLHVQNVGRDITVNGSIMHRSTISPATSTVTGTVLYEDNLSQTQFLAENINLFRRKESIGDEISGTARIYDEVHGWIDMGLATPWGIRQGESFPHHGGPVVGRTDSGAEMLLVSVSPVFVSLQYGSNPGSVNDRAALLRWPELLAAPTSRSPLSQPVADAGASLYAPSGTSVALNAAFSNHPQWQFLSFDWDLVFRPPGSTATLDSSVAVRPNIVLDLPGRYLITLRASDGVRTDDDFVVLTADDGTDPWFTPLEFQLRPDRTAALGDLVLVDKGLVTQESFTSNLPPLNVEVYAPDGEKIGISEDDGSATFHADQRGVYNAILSQGSLSTGGIRPTDFQAVAVETPVVFAPAVTFPISDYPGGLALADLDGDGLSDLIISHGFRDGSTGEIRIHRAISAPTSFAAPTVLTGGDGGSVAVGDISSDGRSDLVTAALGGIVTFIRQPDGSFSGPNSASGACDGGGPTDRALIIADMNNDGRSDVVTYGTCAGTLEIFPQLPDGTLGPAQVIPNPGGKALLATGDLNGDSIEDLVVASRIPVTDNVEGNIAIHYGLPDGGLQDPQYFPDSWVDRKLPSVGVADLDNDGRDDLVYSVSQSSPLIRQVHIYHQASDGTLVKTQVLETNTEFFWLKLFDINRDSLVDIVPSAEGSGLVVYYQQPDHSFADQVRTLLSFERPPRVPPEGLGDVNGDGLADLAFANGYDQLTLLLGIE